VALLVMWQNLLHCCVNESLYVKAQRSHHTT